MKFRLMRADGSVVSDTLAENIFEMAGRGLMTEEGAKLRVIPDTRYGKCADGLWSMKSVKTHEVETLGSRYGKTTNLALGT